MSTPAEEDQQALVSCLKELLAVAGRGEFLHGPVLRCTPEYFPDEWRPDLDGATTMLRRLLGYAGMGRVAFDVYPYSHEGEWTPDSGLDALEWKHRQDHGTVAFYAGRPEGRLQFGIDDRAFGSPEYLAGVLAHEIAHAWRDQQGVVVDDREEEEELTDITTFVLGFGLLTTNNALRARQTGGLDGSYAWTRHSVSSTGYLPPDLMAWLLAMQVVLREDRALQSALADDLEPTQRQTFKAGVKAMTAEGLREALDLPERSAVAYAPPDFAAPTTLPAPVPEPARVLTPLADDGPGTDIAFRVRQSSSPGVAFLVSLLGVVTGIGWGVWWPLLAAPVAYVLWAKVRPTWVCSTTGCEAGVALDDEWCRGCRAQLVGTIGSMREKFDAEREYLLRTAGHDDGLQHDVSLDLLATGEGPSDPDEEDA